MAEELTNLLLVPLLSLDPTAGCHILILDLDILYNRLQIKTPVVVWFQDHGGILDFGLEFLDFLSWVEEVRLKKPRKAMRGTAALGCLRLRCTSWKPLFRKSSSSVSSATLCSKEVFLR